MDTDDDDNNGDSDGDDYDDDDEGFRRRLCVSSVTQVHFTISCANLTSNYLLY